MSKEMRVVQHAALLSSFTGRWRVTMTVWDERGAATRADNLLAEAVLFADGRYVRETLCGDFGGGRHEKLTLLGWNATRERFEYATADNHDGVILLYTSLPGHPGSAAEIELYAEYAAPGENGAGADFVTIRTVLTGEGSDRRRLRNFYRPAGRPERPFLEYVYSRSD